MAKMNFTEANWPDWLRWNRVISIDLVGHCGMHSTFESLMALPTRSDEDEGPAVSVLKREQHIQTEWLIYPTIFSRALVERL